MNGQNVEFLKVLSNDDFPQWAKRETIVRFFHETMKPYQDTPEDIERALDYAFSSDKCEGGFLMLAHSGDELLGALLMLNTGMKGYIPENILLFVSVSPEMRGKGIGGKLCRHCIDEVDGEVKLHVDYPNPARHLYERLGFTTKYAEMRLKR